jgi:hypothetical protein
MHTRARAHTHTHTHSWSNSTGTKLWPDDGKFLGDVPDGSKQRLFYWFLNKHLASTHGYTIGKDLFLIPYDWRTGIQGLEQVRGGAGGRGRGLMGGAWRGTLAAGLVIGGCGGGSCQTGTGTRTAGDLHRVES